jgi:hypothetical protein
MQQVEVDFVNEGWNADKRFLRQSRSYVVCSAGIKRSTTGFRLICIEMVKRDALG